MNEEKILQLPQPRFEGDMSIEEAFKLRRTVRSFSNKEVDLSVISQLLWALQGITRVSDSLEEKKAYNLPEDEKVYYKAAPSAGRSYPLRAYVASSKGLYLYEPIKHELHLINDEDVREGLAEAAIAPHNKEAIKTTPLTIILTADNGNALKATPVMENAVRFVHLEAGHATQNLILQAISFGLGVCTMTSYQIGQVYRALKLPLEHRPIYILPIGFPKEAKQ